MDDRITRKFTRDDKAADPGAGADAMPVEAGPTPVGLSLATGRAWPGKDQHRGDCAGKPVLPCAVFHPVFQPLASHARDFGRSSGIAVRLVGRPECRFKVGRPSGPCREPELTVLRELGSAGRAVRPDPTWPRCRATVVDHGHSSAWIVRTCPGPGTAQVPRWFSCSFFRCNKSLSVVNTSQTRYKSRLNRSLPTRSLPASGRMQGASCPCRLGKKRLAGCRLFPADERSRLPIRYRRIQPSGTGFGSRESSA